MAYHSWPVLRRDPQAVACVSGNGMCQVYVKANGWGHEPSRDEIAAPHPGLIEMLLAEPATDVVVTRSPEGEGWLIVESRDGAARLRETPGGRHRVRRRAGYRPAGPAARPAEAG